MQGCFLSVGTMLVEGENSRIIPVPDRHFGVKALGKLLVLWGSS
jgi:hypothetical protein